MTHQEGKTVILSSHNLDEVQRICNRIALINKGQIKLYGELNALQQQMGHREVVIETSEFVTSSVLAGIVDLPQVSIKERSNNILVFSLGEGADVANIVNFLTQQGVRIEQVKRRDASVEEIYTAIMKEAERQ
jgi:ABC-2 type transport system ATP-binding protein